MQDKIFLDTKIIIYELDTIVNIVDFDLSTQIKDLHIKDKYNLQFYD